MKISCLIAAYKAGNYIGKALESIRAQEHPDWETTPYEGSFAHDFGTYGSLADLFRQIGYDERLHKLESETNMREPRFR